MTFFRYKFSRIKLLFISKKPTIKPTVVGFKCECGWCHQKRSELALLYSSTKSRKKRFTSIVALLITYKVTGRNDLA